MIFYVKCNRRILWIGYKARFQKFETVWILKKATKFGPKNVELVTMVEDYFYFLYSLRWFSSTKSRPQAKVDNFAVKISHIIIEGLFWNRKNYFIWKKFETQKNNLINKFYFDPTFFLIAFYQILEHFEILINHESFFQRKDFPQFRRFWFLKINSLMAETIKKTFSKATFL